VYPCGTLERPIMEKVILHVSRMHECQFCVNSHLAITRELGITEAAATPREKLAVQYARQMTQDANRIPDDLFDELRATFTPPEIVELTFLTGLITLLNRFNNALQVRYGGEYDSVTVS
jgi:AhpD family alkylhydroperoxidase